MSDEVDPRLTRVSETLADTLERAITSHRTFDRKALTEGEVMTALARIICRRSPNDKRLTEWVANIHIAAMVIFRQRKA